VPPQAHPARLAKSPDPAAAKNGRIGGKALCRHGAERMRAAGAERQRRVLAADQGRLGAGAVAARSLEMDGSEMRAPRDTIRATSGPLQRAWGKFMALVRCANADRAEMFGVAAKAFIVVAL